MFENLFDYCVFMNDWFYGFVLGIFYIVVWICIFIVIDDIVGDMMYESRKIVVDFIKRFFVDWFGLGGEKKVIWFKNWVVF